MAEYQTARPIGVGTRTAAIDAGLRAHMNKVYGLMSVGMLLTGGVAWAVGTNEAMLQAIFATPLKWVVMFAPLVMVFAFSAMINRLSYAAAQLFFYVFAAAMGLSISYIFAVYTGVSIAQTFFVTAIAFASLSLYGYTTKKDLSGMGTFLMMGLIGLIVASFLALIFGAMTLLEGGRTLVLAPEARPAGTVFFVLAFNAGVQPLRRARTRFQRPR